jgi:hypothetical protein
MGKSLEKAMRVAALFCSVKAVLRSREISTSGGHHMEKCCITKDIGFGNNRAKGKGF